MGWRQNVFLCQSFGDNKVIKKTRILTHLYVKIWITSNTFSWLVRHTSNKQAKLRVTLRNLFARFSAKRNTDRKNQLAIVDRKNPTNKLLADIMAKCCVVFSQSPFEDLTAFRVRHVLLLVSILTSNAPEQCAVGIVLGSASVQIRSLTNYNIYHIMPLPIQCHCLIVT